MTLSIHIQPGSGEPLYRQIADEVRAAFLRGDLRAGDKLPSVRALAAQLGMNPTTIVKAYDVLAAERLIVRRQGQGAFVAGGSEPLHEGEQDERLRQAAARLALEGRRLGWTEKQLAALLREELQKLRPEKKR